MWDEKQVGAKIYRKGESRAAEPIREVRIKRLKIDDLNAV